jgi:hypothetical protein
MSSGPTQYNRYRYRSVQLPAGSWFPACSCVLSPAFGPVRPYLSYWFGRPGTAVLRLVPAPVCSVGAGQLRFRRISRHFVLAGEFPKFPSTGRFPLSLAVRTASVGSAVRTVGRYRGTRSVGAAVRTKIGRRDGTNCIGRRRPVWKVPAASASPTAVQAKFHYEILLPPVNFKNLSNPA